jgi:hypothetical protein
MKHMSRGERFIAAFNDIEDKFRRTLNPDKYKLSGTEPVSRVLAFTEPCERVLFASPAITAAEAVDKLTHGGEGRTPVTALLITEDGLESGTPTGIITSSDLPELSTALRTDPF